MSRKRLKIGTLKRKLSKAFSLMIRKRDAGKPCISCGQYRTLQAGHFVRAKILSTRWHPWNVNGECAGCNGLNESHIIGYYEGLQKKYGSGTPQELVKISRIKWEPSREQLERLILACGHELDYESEWSTIVKESLWKPSV